MKETLNKHQQRTEATRKKLLAAALRVFSRDGFERSRLQDIAAEAGHTRGAFYANFSSKEDLFIALLEHQAATRVAEVLKAIEENSGDAEECRKAIRAYYQSRARDRQWNILTLEFKLYILRNSKHRAQFAEALQRIRAYHFELIQSVPSASVLGSGGERYRKILLGVVLNGLLLEHACDPKHISSDEVKDLLGQVFDLLTTNALRQKPRRLPATG